MSILRERSYKVLAIARDSEDLKKQLVVYQGLYNSPEFGNNPVWARELNDFVAEAEKDGRKIKRLSLSNEFV